MNQKYIPDYPGKKEKMDWWALRKNKCPKCGDDLDFSDSSLLLCSGRQCSFNITPKRMSEIVSDQNSKDVNNKLTD